MEAGKLRHTVVIESLVTGSPQRHPNGELVQEWTAYLAGVSAMVEPLSGRELFAAQEEHSEATTRVRIRYREGIAADMRVVFGGQYYDIVSVIDRGMRHVELWLMCKSGVKYG